jgi:hypothetical protein
MCLMQQFILNETLLELSLWFAGSTGAKILPKDGVVDVPASIKLESALQGNDSGDIICKETLP